MEREWVFQKKKTTTDNFLTFQPQENATCISEGRCWNITEEQCQEMDQKVHNYVC